MRSTMPVDRALAYYAVLRLVVTKMRLSVSVESEHADLIRAAAAEGGQDISAFLVTAGLAEAARRQRIAAAFADIDQAIAAAEAEAEHLVWPTEDLATDEAEQVRRHIAVARATAARVRGSAA